jgi:hypothetical protein
VSGTALLSDDPHHRDGQVTIAALWQWTWSRSDSVEVSCSCVAVTSITRDMYLRTQLGLLRGYSPAVACTEVRQGRISPYRTGRWEEAGAVYSPPEERVSRPARYSHRNPQVNRAPLRNAVLTRF